MFTMKTDVLAEEGRSPALSVPGAHAESWPLEGRSRTVARLGRTLPAGGSVGTLRNFFPAGTEFTLQKR